MREFRGPVFERVRDYGKRKAEEFPGIDVDKTVFNHLRAWVTSVVHAHMRGRIEERRDFVDIEVERCEYCNLIIGVRTNVG
jgi:hypothetical protein